MLTWRAKPTETHPGWEMEKRLLQSPEVKVRCVLFYSNSQEHGLTVKRSNTFLGTSDTEITQNFSLNHFRAGLVTQWSPALRIEMIIMEKKASTIHWSCRIYHFESQMSAGCRGNKQSTDVEIRAGFFLFFLFFFLSVAVGWQFSCQDLSCIHRPNSISSCRNLPAFIAIKVMEQ